MPSRDEIVLEYLERLPYAPYPVQEEALYAWAACDQGVLLSAPTGTGKTLVAEAAVYEGLRTGKSVYYSTPLGMQEAFKAYKNNIFKNVVDLIEN